MDDGEGSFWGYVRNCALRCAQTCAQTHALPRGSLLDARALHLLRARALRALRAEDSGACIGDGQPDGYCSCEEDGGCCGNYWVLVYYVVDGILTPSKMTTSMPEGREGGEGREGRGGEGAEGGNRYSIAAGA